MRGAGCGVRGGVVCRLAQSEERAVDGSRLLEAGALRLCGAHLPKVEVRVEVWVEAKVVEVRVEVRAMGRRRTFSEPARSRIEKRP